MHTVGLGDGRWANAGAEWVNTEHVLVRGLAARFGIELVAPEGFEALVVDGIPVVDDDEPAGFRALVDDALSDVEDLERPWEDEVLLRLDRSSVAVLVDRLPSERPPGRGDRARRGRGTRHVRARSLGGRARGRHRAVAGDAAAHVRAVDREPHQPAGGPLTAYGTQPLAPAEVESTFDAWFPGLGVPSATAVEAWWSEDEFTRCTYSAPRPGDLAALGRPREPFGPILFTGEHTEPVSGYVESAVRSGRRAAGRIIGAGSPGSR